MRPWSEEQAEWERFKREMWFDRHLSEKEEIEDEEEYPRD